MEIKEIEAKAREFDAKCGEFENEYEAEIAGFVAGYKQALADVRAEAERLRLLEPCDAIWVLDKIKNFCEVEK